MAARDLVPALMAEFDSPDRLREAAARLRESGYRRLEFYSPFPVDGAEAVLRLPRPLLPRLVLVIGICGAAGTLWVQWFANGWNYPLNVGNRPLLSVPAWVPITFELSMLSAGFAAFFGMLARSGLPRLWHPVFTTPGFENASADGFWLAVGVDDPRYDAERTRLDLEALDPLRIAAPEEEP